MLSIAIVTEAAETATETAESFHMTVGEFLVSTTALVLTVATVVLCVVSVRLVKVTAMATNIEMARVSMNANDDMADVAKTAILAPHAPKPSVSLPRHRSVYRTVTRHVV